MQSLLYLYIKHYCNNNEYRFLQFYHNEIQKTYVIVKNGIVNV